MQEENSGALLAVLGFLLSLHPDLIRFRSILGRLNLLLWKRKLNHG